MTHPKEEKTYVMIKPDGVQKGLIGEIYQAIRTARIESNRFGEMFQPTHEEIDNHYPKDEAWITSFGK